MVEGLLRQGRPLEDVGGDTGRQAGGGRSLWQRDVGQARQREQHGEQAVQEDRHWRESGGWGRGHALGSGRVRRVGKGR